MLLKLCRAVSALLLATLALLALVLVVPQILGYKVLAVLGSSMEPALPVGGITYVRPAAPDSVSRGDIILFSLPDSPVPATHRVLEVDRAARTFTTKGDANTTPDAPVPFDALIGKAVLSLPLAGYLVSLIRSRAGIAAATCLLIALIVSVFLPEVLRTASSPARGESESARHQ